MGMTTDDSFVAAPTALLVPPSTEVGTTRDSRSSGAAAGVPIRLGRYVVLDRLGQGGMGVVYSAFDPELDRKVAIKLLRRVELLGEAAQRRLLREAQALARLSHTNVVAVHDVGIVDGQLFIAMEFVQGQTLRAWMAAPRRWQDALAVFMQAGRGLAAAHAGGFVHRDVKPDNVMVGDDGRVVVMDFGLARPEVPAGPDPSESMSTTDNGVHPGLTQTGSLLGTPAYMSPEQFATTKVDARSDQFSFCVTLYEALYGVRPFPGDNVAELRGSVLLRDPLPPPRGTAVPGRVHQALLRGLQRDPSRRYNDMPELLAALAADPWARRRQRMAMFAAVVVGGLAALVGSGAMYGWRADAGACVGGELQMVGVWDPAVAEATRAALVGTGVPYAEDVATRVVSRLDAYAGEWARMHREACETHRRDEQSDALFDLRMACLDERRTAVRALASVLKDADAEVVKQAVQAAEDVPSVGRCADAPALLAESPPPEDPEVARAVDELRPRLATLWARRRVGQYAAVAAEAGPLRGEAEALGYAPLLAEILQLEALVAADLGDFKAAEATLIRSIATADGAGADELRVHAQLELMRVVGLDQARFAEGMLLGELTGGALKRLSDASRFEAVLEARLGEVALQHGEYARAQGYIERSIELQRKIHGEDSLEFAGALSARGGLRFFRGELAAALADYRRALAINERHYGAHHPVVGVSLNNVGAVELTQFDAAAAEATFTRVRQILEGAFGETHPSLGALHSNLALIAVFQGRPLQAIAEDLRALEIYEKHLPADHPSIADTLRELGEAQLLAGDVPAALRTFERSLAVHVAAFGVGHAKVSVALANLGLAQLRAGDHAAAERSFTRATSELRGPADAPELGQAFAGLGALRLAQGRVDEAVADLESALDRLQRSANAAPYHIAAVQFALAQALWQQSRTNEGRTRSLAADAQRNFASVGLGFQAEAAKVWAWLAQLPAAAE
jgi:tetratricopeptide (TPR) repeat protein/predicted Ser/Thr protein kinase